MNTVSLVLEETAESSMELILLINALMMVNARETKLNAPVLKFALLATLNVQITAASKVLEKLISVIAFKIVQEYFQMGL